MDVSAFIDRIAIPRPDVVIPLVLAAAAVLGAGALAFVVRSSYRASVRRVLRELIQQKEGVKALVGGVTEARSRLLRADAQDRRVQFVFDPTSPERAPFVDLADRAQQLVDALDSLAVPKKLVKLAEGLADIAFVVERDLTSMLGTEGNPALEQLERLDTARLTEAIGTVEEQMDIVAVKYGVREVAVYQGGLYV